MNATRPPLAADSALDPGGFLRREAERVERALEAVVALALASVPAPLREPMQYALGTRGKRLRPVLCCAAFRAVAENEPGPGVYRLACALELIHTYSLVHDDLPCMDDDDLRRGRPTVHRVFGEQLATLAGAALIPLSVQVLDGEAAALGLGLAERGWLVAELCQAAGAAGMVGGQLLDLEAETERADAAALEAIHRAKTGALLAASLRIGGYAARATAEQLGALTEYGEALGLAFQIADDVLDVTGDSATLGKTAGRDASLGKSTYPSIFGVDGARRLAERWAGDAAAALRRGRVHSPELEMLARYVVERPR